MTRWDEGMASSYFQEIHFNQEVIYTRLIYFLGWLGWVGLGWEIHSNKEIICTRPIYFLEWLGWVGWVGKFILIKKLYTHDISIFRWLQKSKALHVFMNSYQKYEKDGFSNDDSDKMFDVFQIHRVKWFLIEFMKLFGCRYLFQSMNLKCIKIDVRFIILMQRFRFSNSSWFLEFSSVILESWIRLFKYFFDYSIIRLLNYSILENWIIRTTDPYRQPLFTPRPHPHVPCAPCPSPSLSLGPLHLALTHTNSAPLAPRPHQHQPCAPCISPSPALILRPLPSHTHPQPRVLF
jgi:hypothetical protein